MKKLTLLATFALLVPLIAAQEAGENGSFRPEEEPEDTGPAICGDNVCQAIEEGVCPQDCQEDYVEENSSSDEETSESSPPSIATIAVAAGSLLVILLSLTGLLKIRRSSEENEDDSELEEWMNQQINDGYRYREIKEFLKEEGYTEEEIENAYREISR